MTDSEARDRMFQDEEIFPPKPNEHVLRPLDDGCQANDSPELLGDQYYAQTQILAINAVLSIQSTHFLRMFRRWIISGAAGGGKLSAPIL